MKKVSINTLSTIKIFATLTLITPMLLTSGCMNTAALKTAAVLSGNPNTQKAALVLNAHEQEEKRIKQRQEAERKRAIYEKEQAERRRALANMTPKERAAYEIQQKKADAARAQQGANALGVLGNIFAPTPVIIAR